MYVQKSSARNTLVRRSNPWRRNSAPSSSLKRVLMITVMSCLLFILLHLYNSTATLDPGKNKNQCWLKHAFHSGEFTIFSHRSYADSTISDQPSCEDSLLQLKTIGVNHLDLDLVLDENSGGITPPRIIVGHPMEYKGTSDYYSPCANTEFDDMVQLLKKVYGNDFFISLEPKASWGKTQKELDDPALTNLPSSILKKLLDAVRSNELKGNCAAIVEINPIQDREEVEREKKLLNDILNHCKLFKGIRISDSPPQSIGEYDLIMPTIEFHPMHSHNTDAKIIPPQIWKKSISWVVDNEEDLQLAADLRPYGIVTNSPANIVSIINSSVWCQE